MSETKHTPGPWQIEKTDAFVNNQPRYSLVGQDGEWLGWLNKWPDHPKESAANARLIAAAPELLNSAKEALAHFDRLDCKDSLRLAIAKAEE